MAARFAMMVALAGPPDAAAQSCGPTSGDAAVVADVEPRLELRLDDGRLLRLVGLDPALRTPDHPELDEMARDQLASVVKGRRVMVRTLSGAPDRWGRWPAFAVLADGADDAGLTQRAIAAGLGRYLAEPAAHGCRTALLAAEASARAAKLGLWSDPYYGVIGSGDEAAFLERSGTTVLAEARLVAVEPGPYRTKLRFDAQRSHGRRLLSAVLLPRVVKSFEAQGVRFETLIGRTLRVRGLLDLRFGPQIELAGPDDLEVVDAAVPTP